MISDLPYFVKGEPYENACGYYPDEYTLDVNHDSPLTVRCPWGAKYVGRKFDPEALMSWIKSDQVFHSCFDSTYSSRVGVPKYSYTPIFMPWGVRIIGNHRVFDDLNLDLRIYCDRGRIVAVRGYECSDPVGRATNVCIDVSECTGDRRYGKYEARYILDKISQPRCTWEDFEMMVALSNEVRDGMWHVKEEGNRVWLLRSDDGKISQMSTSREIILEILEWSYAYLDIGYRKDFWYANQGYLDLDLMDPMIQLLSFCDIEKLDDIEMVLAASAMRRMNVDRLDLRNSGERLKTEVAKIRDERKAAIGGVQ